MNTSQPLILCLEVVTISKKLFETKPFGLDVLMQDPEVPVSHFLCLHSHGGTGSGSTHSPRLAALASFSASA